MNIMKYLFMFAAMLPLSGVGSTQVLALRLPSFSRRVAINRPFAFGTTPVSNGMIASNNDVEVRV
jgi:hypothetical protein